MEIYDEHIDALLARYLAGETTPEEAIALQAWVAASPENARYLADLQAIWQKTPALRPADTRAVDTEAALQKVQTRIRAHTPRMVRLTVVWRAAAALALAVAAVYFLWMRNLQAPDMVIAATHLARTDTLADGSVLTLGPQSGVALAAGFNTRERRMRLHGAATFDVQPDTTRPFIVAVQDLEIRVVGTVFRVDNALEPSRVQVDVLEGKVRVRVRGQSALLVAGEQAIYDQKAGTLKHVRPQGRVFRFDATPLREVIQQIEQVYGMPVFLKNNALENCPLTARYNNLPVERVLELVAESFSIQLEKTATGYALDGKGCE
ncbi:MAG: FecR domain-containing protein [Lewinellaceae bacterium]|nr:FecR domain-containing protein [Lewinellaceae bacterium]